MAGEIDLCVAYETKSQQPASGVDCRSFTENGEVSGTLQARGDYSLIRTGYIVRRLTPTECERLMSLCSGYTEFGHDGKQISDASRYRLLGNSIVVNVLAPIMQNIAERLGGTEQ
jgi:DNA (cytosine-5)-methyltransferase 1